MLTLGLVFQCILVSVIVVCLASLGYRKSRKYRRYPPGPLALPIIGNLLNLGTDPRQTLQNYGKLYGDVFSVYFGPQLAVILNSYESIREAFVQHGSVFNDRPDFFFQDIWDNKGIATVNGQLWKQQKRFAVQAMNSLGRKKEVFQKSIEREATLLVEFFLSKSKDGSSLDMMSTVLPAVCSVICEFLWSARCDVSDAVTVEKLDRMKENFELIGGTQILNIFPSLKHIPGDPFRYKKFIQNIKQDITLNQDCIYQHNLSRDPDNPRDYVDVFLNEADLQKNNSNHNYTDAQLHRVLLDMFGAGTQSSAAILVWALLYMLHYPHVLEKVQKEILEAVGTREHIVLEDRPNLLYTEATVLEIIRMSDVTPLGIPHATSQDITFKGFHIPKGTMVMSNLNAVSRDPNLWYNPKDFMPERFLLQEDGITRLHKPDYFIPFSTGKRSCPGNNLAVTELLIFFANMMHNLDFIVPNNTLPSLEGVLSTVYMPPEVKVVAKRRNLNLTSNIEE